MIPKLDLVAEGFEVSRENTSFLNVYSYNVANQPTWNLGLLNPLFDKVHNGLFWCVLGVGSSNDEDIPQLGYRLMESNEFFGIKSEEYLQGLAFPLRIFYERLEAVLGDSRYSSSKIKFERSGRSEWRRRGFFFLDDFCAEEVLELTKKLRESFPEEMLKSHCQISLAN